MRALIPVAALAVAVPLALTGCSQIAAIAPVGGVHVSEVRYAALDILVQKEVDVLTVPVCTTVERAVTCTGSTLDGAAIEVDSPADDPTNLTVTVDGAVLYSGSIQDVLDAAVEPAP